MNNVMLQRDSVRPSVRPSDLKPHCWCELHHNYLHFDLDDKLMQFLKRIVFLINFLIFFPGTWMNSCLSARPLCLLLHAASCPTEAFQFVISRSALVDFVMAPQFVLISCDWKSTRCWSWVQPVFSSLYWSEAGRDLDTIHRTHTPKFLLTPPFLHLLPTTSAATRTKLSSPQTRTACTVTMLLAW